MSEPKAFVIVCRSDMRHNRDDLFYRVAKVTDYGYLHSVIDDSLYPYAWGFSDVKNALRVADHYNDRHLGPDDETVQELATRLAKAERPGDAGK